MNAGFAGSKVIHINSARNILLSKKEDKRYERIEVFFFFLSETVKNVQESDKEVIDEEVLTVIKAQSKENPCVVTVELDYMPVEMEIDTRALLTIIIEETLKKIKQGLDEILYKCHRRLKT